MDGASGRNRTGKTVKSANFKSAMFTNFITEARGTLCTVTLLKSFKCYIQLTWL